jgi:anti-sigma factor RsiW
MHVTKNEWTCKELVERVTDYLENELTVAELSRFKIHLSACPACDLYIHQIQITIRALSAMPSPELRSEVGSVLLKGFRSWKAQNAH